MFRQALSFAESFVTYINRAFKQVQDTFGRFKYFEFDPGTDRLQNELSFAEDRVGMLVAIHLHSTFQQEIECIL